MPSTLQSNIEDLLHKSEGTTIENLTTLGLPKIADTMISSVELINTRDGVGKGFNVDISWSGKTALLGTPGLSLKDNPAKVSVFRTTGGGLILRTKQLTYKGQDFELVLHGNIYKIKGMTVSYSF
jgi:hypothetical protein